VKIVKRKKLQRKVNKLLKKEAHHQKNKPKTKQITQVKLPKTIVKNVQKVNTTTTNKKSKSAQSNKQTIKKLPTLKNTTFTRVDFGVKSFAEILEKKNQEKQTPKQNITIKKKQNENKISVPKVGEKRVLPAPTEQPAKKVVKVNTATPVTKEAPKTIDSKLKNTTNNDNLDDLDDLDI